MKNEIIYIDPKYSEAASMFFGKKYRDMLIGIKNRNIQTPIK